ILFALSLLALLSRAEDAAYIGSRTCAGCHRKIYLDYGRTAMGRSMDVGDSPVQNQIVPAPAWIFSEKLNRHFEVSREGSALFQTEYEIDSGGREVFRTKHKLEYVVGSGVNGYGYIVRRGKYLFQAPLSYYSRKKAWGLSPGYEFADYGFNRPIAAACIACHSGRPQPVRDRVGLFGDPAFAELAIGCENCHGPGSLHAAKRAKPGSAVPGEPDRTIVNPASLPSRLAEDICMNCHQGSDTRVLQPGKDIFDFRPGTPLNETLAILRAPLKRDASESDLLEHHSSMQLSKCYRSSGGRLSCLTCHQIHSMPKASEAAAYYRGRCLTCHEEANCKVSKPSRLEHANDCAGCHMPKRGVEVLAHAVLTNHRIIARPGESLPDAAFTQGTSDLPDLVYFNGPVEGTRASLPPIMLLQAYGELMRKHPEYEQRYLSVLDDLGRNGKPQPLVEAALGRKMLQSGDLTSNSGPIDHLARAIELGFKAPTVYEDLAEALLRAGREADAVSPLQQGIEVAPYTPVLHKSLALRYINLQRYSAARKTLEHYVELFPEDDFVRGLLLKVPQTDSSGQK
ncbi:MAG: hypothetical protein JWO48_1430, partial [Bryobacterales bacterium]|nr:hypothetical protein [Bryobacterales bacterium]